MKKTRAPLVWFVGCVTAICVPALSAQTGIVLVRHAPSLNGDIDGSVQQITAESVTLNGNATVTGDLFVPGTPSIRLNGKPTYAGTLDGPGVAAPSNYQVTLNGNITLRHTVRRTDPIALPAVGAPSSPTGTRTVSINSAGQSAGDFATLRNLTLNGNAGQYTIPPGTYGNFTANGNGGFTLGVAGATQPVAYNFQQLTLNGNGDLRVVGPVTVTLANAFAVNGTVGSAANPAWLTLKLPTGGVTLNGNVWLSGYVVAPSGTVTINGNSQLVGGVISDRLVLNGNSLLRLVAPPVPNVPPAVTLDSPANNATYPALATITLSARATDSDGTIARVEFFQGTTKLGESTTLPYQFVVFGRVAGTYSFAARATDNVGDSTDSVPVTVTVTSPVNQPPTVALTAPPDGAIYHAPAAIALSATASDPDGAVVKVEYLQGGVKLGEVAGAPYDFTWANVHPGTYALTAKAYDNSGASVMSASRGVTVSAVVPYFTGFEPADGFTVGALSGQAGWTASSGAAVTGSLSYGGAQSIFLPASQPPGQAAQTFAFTAGQTVVFADLFAKPAPGATPASSTIIQTEIAQIAWVQSGAQGEAYTFDGNGVGGGIWRPTGFKVPLSTSGETVDWLRLTLREEFVTRKWDLYANGHLVAYDQRFVDDTKTVFSRFSLIGASAGSTAVDDFFVGFDNPLFADADKDGMEDAWETANGLNPTLNDRDADNDGDGLSNIREYLLGLRADKASTYDDGIPDSLRVALGLSLTGPTIDTTPPSAPTNVAATAIELNVSLTWSASTDNIGVAGYLVSRDGQLLTPSAIQTTALADTVPSYGASYQYTVEAVDFAGNHSPPGSAQVDIPAPDTNGNGLPDDWELTHFGQLGADPNADADGDGLTNLQEFQNGTEPNDFYNGIVPLVQAANEGSPDSSDALVMAIRKPDGTPWANAPATFQITAGDRRISATPGGPDYSTSVQTRSDANGIAKAYLEPL